MEEVLSLLFKESSSKHATIKHSSKEALGQDPIATSQAFLAELRKNTLNELTSMDVRILYKIELFSINLGIRLTALNISSIGIRTGGLGGLYSPPPSLFLQS